MRERVYPDPYSNDSNEDLLKFAKQFENDNHLIRGRNLPPAPSEGRGITVARFTAYDPEDGKVKEYRVIYYIYDSGRGIGVELDPLMSKEQTGLCKIIEERLRSHLEKKFLYHFAEDFEFEILNHRPEINQILEDIGRCTFDGRRFNLRLI